MIALFPKSRVVSKYGALLIMVFFWIAPKHGGAQDQVYVDSLLTVLKTSPEDTNKVSNLRELYWEYSRADPHKAKGYLEQSINLALSLKYNRGIGAGKYALSGELKINGNIDSARILLVEAQRIYRKLGDSVMVNTCRLDIGWLYQSQRKYVKAAQLIMQAIRGYEEYGEDKHLARAYNTLGILYLGQDKYSEALDAYQKALEKCDAIDLKQGISVCNGNIASVLYHLKRYDEALTYFEKTILLQKERNDRIGLVKSYNNIGLLYNDLENYELALDYHMKALEMYEEMDFAEGLALVHLNIGLDQYGLNQYLMAIDHYEQSAEIATTFDFPETRVKAYGSLADAYAVISQYDSAYHYAQLHKEHNDSLNIAINNMQVAELQTQYETEQKEKQIALLSMDNQITALKLRRNRNLNYAGGIFSVLSVLLAYFLFQNYKHRRSVREIKIQYQADQKVMEMEQRILNTVIDTEEKERKRFATDLHDELGPLLSSIMLYLDEIPRVSGKEQEEMVTYTQDLVEEAIREVRDISHNIMPGAISELGLIQALQVFCAKIDRTKTINVHFENKTEEARFKPGVEVVLYRVLIELMNNTLKHANADHIYLVLSGGSPTLEIKYQDDGNGFDLEKAMHDSESGLGLKNIEDRITSLDGKIEIKSEEHKGVEVSIIVDL
jgi:signal transduction histidine kinase